MTELTAESYWVVARGNKLYPMCRLCFGPRHDGPCEKSDAMIEYWNARASDADADAARCRGRATEIANLQLAELAQLRADLAQAKKEIDACHNIMAEVRGLTSQPNGLTVVAVREELDALRAALAQAQAERDEWRRKYEQAEYLARDAQTERADQAEARAERAEAMAKALRKLLDDARNVIKQYVDAEVVTSWGMQETEYIGGPARKWLRKAALAGPEGGER